jgi:hypothetical protein
MSIEDIRSGSVIRYSYLWAREADRGETEGRKDRPVCVMLIIAREGREIAILYPITSQAPTGKTRALAIPQIEARRVGLDIPAWIVISEQNEDYLPKSYSLISKEPLGRFSKTFTQSIIIAALTSLREGSHRRIDRS